MQGARHLLNLNEPEGFLASMSRCPWYRADRLDCWL